jgi:metal-responsive CopG/Arc/MetJ family transcriptional regulator
MKVAISLPDKLFREGEAISRRLGIPRSELYARALATYVERLEQRDVTERLNDVYAEEPAAVEAGLARAQAKVLRGERW